MSARDMRPGPADDAVERAFADTVAAARDGGCARGAGDDPQAQTGMAAAVLREIAEHLAAVVAGAERRVVGLRGLPLSQGDVAALRAALGPGEVTAAVAAAGRTEIEETGLRGVWWVRQTTDDGRTVVEQIEIGTIPEILEAHPDDIAASARALADRCAAEPRGD